MKSTLTKSQKKSVEKIIENKKYILNMRHDDRCGNGHNTFSITLDVYEKIGNRWREDSFGCQHETVKEIFPEFSHMTRWHLCSIDGPMHYIADSLYWIREENIEYARNSAIWPEAKPEDFTEDNLKQRLENLLIEFKSSIEGLGFKY